MTASTLDIRFRFSYVKYPISATVPARGGSYLCSCLVSILYIYHTKP
jgi:hypothetical protein